MIDDEGRVLTIGYSQPEQRLHWEQTGEVMEL